MHVQKVKLNFFQNRLFRKKSARDTTTGTKNLKRGGRRKRAARPRKRHEPKEKVQNSCSEIWLLKTTRTRTKKILEALERSRGKLNKKKTQNSKQTNNMKQQRPGIKHKRKKEAT